MEPQARITAKVEHAREVEGFLRRLGWSVAVPTLLGAMLGLWLDRRHPGVHSWTLSLLIVGLAIGCLNAWHWVTQEQEQMHEGPEDQHD